mmetsp:Transcript_136474/g.435835  ORF Transcript_136474/g.435835 Transcript_136474/m.435835 type:complete len:131 (-) Transcript_136474:21-413(-)
MGSLRCAAAFGGRGRHVARVRETAWSKRHHFPDHHCGVQESWTAVSLEVLGCHGSASSGSWSREVPRLAPSAAPSPWRSPSPAPRSRGAVQRRGRAEEEEADAAVQGAAEELVQPTAPARRLKRLRRVDS